MSYQDIIDVCEFNVLLKSAMDDHDNAIVHDKTSEDNLDICLVSFEPLDDTQIELNCGHKFNYNSIFYAMVGQISSLKQCPYCRTNIHGVLPFCSDYKKISRVNSPASRLLSKYKYKMCKYVLSRGKRVGETCGKNAIFPFNCCKNHHKKYTTDKNPVIPNTGAVNEIIVSNITIQKPMPEVVNHKKGKYRTRCEAVIKTGKSKGGQCKCWVYVNEFSLFSQNSNHAFLCGYH